MENTTQSMPNAHAEMTASGAGPVQTVAMGPAFPGPSPWPFPPSPMMPGPSMGPAGHSGQTFPRPTPSPWPPSPMMPGPTMQPQWAPGPMPQDMAGGHAESQGHSCGKSASHSHPPDHAGPSAPMPHDYLHEAFQFGPAYFSPAVGIRDVGDPRYPAPYAAPDANPTFLGMDFRHDQFWKGAILGAAVVFIVTNDTVQKALMSGVAKLWTTAQAGIEELKEKYQDVKAEMSQKKKEA